MKLSIETEDKRYTIDCGCTPLVFKVIKALLQLLRYIGYSQNDIDSCIKRKDLHTAELEQKIYEKKLKKRFSF